MIDEKIDIEAMAQLMACMGEKHARQLTVDAEKGMGHEWGSLVTTLE